MKWRCTRCGKPHAANDPPCDECGHNAFEEAIVRVDGSEGKRGDGEPIPSGTVETGPEYVWACTNCGREHVRNTPPCSRCGNPGLERVERTYEGIERDLETPSWFEVAKPYLPIFAVIGIVIALFATGIVSPSVLPGIGPPSPPDAPGDGSEAAGIDLEAAEVDVHDRLEAARNESDRRSYDDGLAAYAEYQNRRFVAIELTGADPPRASADEFGPDCGDATPEGAPVVITDESIEAYADESTLADAAATALLERYDEDMRTGFDAEGIDLHVAPNDDIYVFYAAC